MDTRGYRLGVDFGTSNTVAMLARPDGQTRPLLFDGSPTLPSSVYADPQSGLLVGRDAVHAARVAPERFEPNPKRRIDEPSVLLGEQEFGTVELIAAVLGRVAGEAYRVAGGRPGTVTITCPAAWAQTRRGVLTAAAERAGLGTVTLVAEPVAAAHVFHTLTGIDVPHGAAFVVYDLGAGTFDASVVRYGSGTFDVLAAEGLSTSGGLDIDAAIVGYLGASNAGRDPAMWNRLAHPTSSAERRAHRLLWDDVRAAKEMLSRTSSTMIHIPMFDADIPLGRDQFEQLARPILASTVTATRSAIASAGLTSADIAGVFLVGGGSRIPLVATLLHQAIGKAPTAVEQPELVVAQGAVGAQDGIDGPVSQPPPSAFRATEPTSSPVSSQPYSAPPVSSAPPFPGSPPVSSAPPAPAAPTSGVPMSGVPVSGPVGPVSAVPVSPGYGAAPVSPESDYTPPPPPQPPRTYQAASAHRSPPPVSGPPASAPPVSGPPVSGPPTSGPPVSAPPTAVQPPYQQQHQHSQQPAAKPKRTGVLVAAAFILVLLIAGGVYGITKLGDDSGNGESPGGSDSTGGDTTAAVDADVERTDIDWYTTAKEYDGYAGKKIAYTCPAGGDIGTVWGSRPYTTDSSVCTAAVHAGYISLEDGGQVIIEIQKGPDEYEGSLSQGINSAPYGAWPWAFDIVG